MSNSIDDKLVPRERLHYFDVMRGVTMILVVLCHVHSWLGIQISDTVLGTVLVTFRMPLFFFVSGFFAFKACEKWTTSLVKDIMKRKIQAQIICTLVFFSLLQYCNGANILAWTKEGFSGYWFTIVLFQFFLFVFGVFFAGKMVEKTVDTGCRNDIMLIVCSGIVASLPRKRGQDLAGVMYAASLQVSSVFYFRNFISKIFTVFCFIFL